MARSRLREVVWRRASSVVMDYIALQAKLVLERHRPLVVGVTGSVGKTTTKEIVGAALAHPAVETYVGRVHRTPGNMNSRDGFPQAVLGYDTWATTRRRLFERLAGMPVRTLRLLASRSFPDVLVLEYALGRKTSVRELTKLARPDVALVTPIGPAHLARYGSVERIAADKSALVSAVPPSGLVVLARDNPWSSGMRSLSRAPVVEVAGRGRELAQGLARAVGEFLGVPSNAMELALAEGPPVARRQEIHDLGPFRLLDDSFNANPLSMEFGLETFLNEARPGERRVAILGGMGELGAESARYHREIAKVARERSDVLVGVGELARDYEPDVWFASNVDCAAGLEGLLSPRDFVFVKGSAAVELFVVVRAIRELAGTLDAAHAHGPTRGAGGAR